MGKGRSGEGESAKGAAKDEAKSGGAAGGRRPPRAPVDRTTIGRTIWLTEGQDAAIRARMAAEGRLSMSDFLRAIISRELAKTASAPEAAK